MRSCRIEVGAHTPRSVRSACERIEDRIMNPHPCILVTGGAGFIGSNFVLQWVANGGRVINLDLQTYAGNPENLSSMLGNPGHTLVRGDIGDAALVAALLREHEPQAIVHLAAESHVDRSIVAPDSFVRTNVNGTFTLLDQARHYWSSLAEPERSAFRFLHVSTDEVYGSLGPADPPFSETTPYAPNSPYAASKAASDHLVRAWFHTYGMPTLTTNCSNNYGPFQFPEKLIPLVILNALEGKPLPVYGDGGNVRDWLFVGDHCDALRTVLANGRPGETYNVGGNSERNNLDVVKTICAILDELRPDTAIGPRSKLVTFVPDRPGHDRRYAIDASKITRELGWQPSVRFEEGLRQTIEWYLEHTEWIEHVRTGAYRDWIRRNYDERVAR
jgi:dTDP-glucose 4,6-dehydratase